MKANKTKNPVITPYTMTKKFSVTGEIIVMTSLYFVQKLENGKACSDVGLLDEELLRGSLKFYAFMATWILKLLNPSKNK